MTTRYTQEEWLQVIKNAEQALPATNVQYKAPLLGSEDFSRRIDHTLLKSEATKEQIDQICQEAMRDSFYVSSCLVNRSVAALCHNSHHQENSLAIVRLKGLKV